MSPLSSREGRIFGVTLSAGFFLIALLSMHRHHRAAAAFAFSISMLCLLAALFVPTRLGPAQRAWTRLGESIGYVTTPVFLGIAYYLVLTPTAMVRRLTGHRRRPGNSSWSQRAPLAEREKMERQF